MVPGFFVGATAKARCLALCMALIACLPIDLARAQGEITVEPQALAPRQGDAPALAWGDDQALVVWMQEGRTLGARIKADGTIVDQPGFHIFSEPSPTDVLWMGNGWWVARAKSIAQELELVRITKDGQIAGQTIVPVPGRKPVAPPKLSRGTDHALLVFSGERAPEGTLVVQAVRIDDNLTAIDSPAISLPAQGPSGGAQQPPAVAWNLDHWTVAWAEASGSDLRLIVSRVSPAGTAVGAGRDLGAMAAAPLQAATSGGQLGLFWKPPPANSFGDTLVGVRFSSDDKLLDTVPVTVGTNFSCGLAVAPCEGGWLAYEKDGSTALIDSNLTVTPVLPGKMRCPLEWSSLDALGCGNGSALVVAQVPKAYGHHDAYDASDPKQASFRWLSPLIATVASPRSTTRASGSMLSTARSIQRNPASAAGEDRWLVVWEELDATTGLDLYGAFVRRDGSLLSPKSIPIAVDLLDAERAALAWNGSTFVVAWVEREVNEFNQVFHNVMARPIDRDGNAGKAVLMYPEVEKSTVPQVYAVNDSFFVAMNQRGRVIDVNERGEIVSRSLTLEELHAAGLAVQCPNPEIDGMTLEVSEVRPEGEAVDPTGVLGSSRVVMRVVEATVREPMDCSFDLTPEEQPPPWEPPALDAGSAATDAGQPDRDAAVVLAPEKGSSGCNCKVGPSRNARPLWLIPAFLVSYALRKRRRTIAKQSQR